MNGRDDRVYGRGAVREVLPVSVETDDSLILEVQLVITPDISEPLEPLVAYLHLLGQYTIYVYHTHTHTHRHTHMRAHTQTRTHTHTHTLRMYVLYPLQVLYSSNPQTQPP